MAKILFSILMVISAQACLGQKSFDRSSMKFSSVNQAGLLNGDNGESFSLQTINGITVNKWFAGLGIGIDYYLQRTIPLFADVRRDITSGKNSLFVYGDGGISLPYLTSQQKIIAGWPTTYNHGPCYGVGAGWKLKGKSERSWLLSAGYAYKQLKETVTKTIRGGPGIFAAPGASEYYDNRYRRIVINVGFQL
jgi:hypothetical protein